MEMAKLRIDDARAASGERRGRLSMPDRSHHVLWFRAPSPLDTACGADPFLPTAMLCAMRAGVPLHLEGRASRTLLGGLVEWQAAWTRWRPDRYTRVRITVDEVDDGEPHDGAGVVAFSGGLDAAYTLWRHATGNAGWQQVDLRAAVMVHGFDIALDQADVFESARERAARIVTDAGLDLLTVATNFRELPLDWEDAHALGLVGALTVFSPRFGVGLIGSGEPYERLAVPWGSSPITDHLLSSRTMSIRHDGAGASRTEKIAALANWAVALDNLRVCWQGSRLDRNCGRCEKCRRTRLNLALAGTDDLSMFDTRPTSAPWRHITVHSPAQFAEWESLAAEARAAGRADVRREVEAVLRWSRFRRAVASIRPIKGSYRAVRRLLSPTRT